MSRRRAILARAWGPLLALAVVALPAATSHAAGPCEVAPADLALDAEERAAIDAINALRAAAGAAPLAPSRTLTRSAAWKSAQMAAGAPFDHNDGSRSWQQRSADCGYPASDSLRENLAWGYPASADTVEMWAGSAPHRVNLLAPEARAVGIARANGPRGWMWTAVFGATLDELLADGPQT